MKKTKSKAIYRISKTALELEKHTGVCHLFSHMGVRIYTQRVILMTWEEAWKWA